MIDFAERLGDFLWTYVGIALLIGCAIFFTIRTRFVQFRMIGEMVRIMLGRDQEKKSKKSKIGSFQAFAVSLSSRVGTGNLAGVASAIFIGGPGSIFWMWMMALFGAATAFMEATLAQLYKRKSPDGRFYGGPAYYMERGLGKRWMGVLFSILMVLSFGFANQTVQSNTLTTALSDALGVNQLIIGIILAVLTAVIIIGGINRISKFTSILVPIMALGYIILAMYIMVANITAIPEMLKLIVDNAFGLKQAGGAAIGTAIMVGVKRGLFSNEAGEGSAPNAAAIADTSHPVKQGLIQSLGVFVDTILICTCTAFIIFLSGVYDCGKDGILLTSAAFESELGIAGKYFLTAAIFLFAFSTIIANYYYSETNLYFMFENKTAVRLFRVITGLIILAGATLTLQQTWKLVDLSMVLLTFLNLAAVLLMHGKVVKLLNDYRSQKKKGIKEPEFRKEELFPEISEKLEGWK